MLAIMLMTMSFNFLLFCQESIREYENYDEPIKIRPYFGPEIPQSFHDKVNTELARQEVQSATRKIDNQEIQKPAEWILESAIHNAPKLLKGIFSYLQMRITRNYEKSCSVIVPSFHRFILVGPPGSGKTTMAYALAHTLNYPVIFIGATSFLGRFRNETARNIQTFLKAHASDGLGKVIIIDEVHKLFELHENDSSDDAQNAASFWLALDVIEKEFPNIILVATANNVDKLPPEIKSRFSGKIITMPLPSICQKICAFKQNIAHDKSVALDKSVDDQFIETIIKKIQDCSLRDVRLIVDTAKMFYYAEKSVFSNQFPIHLTKNHFQQALDQLQAESFVLQEKFLDRLCTKLEPWGPIFSAVSSISIVITTFLSLQASLTRLRL